MEDPLISHNGKRSGVNKPLPYNRTDAITYGTPYQKAAALVDLAEDGVGLPEEVLEQSSFENSAKLYFAYTNLDFFWTLNFFALIVLCFLEKPLWCNNNNGHSCNERDYYFLGQLPYLTSIESLIVELITFIILVVHILFPISFEGSELFWKKTMNTVKVFLLLIMAVDILIYVLYLSPVAFSSLPFRISPYIRVIFFVLSIRELWRSVIVLAGMLPTYLNVMALSLLFLLFSSWIAYVMFEDTKQGDEVFTSFGATLYQMFVLFTTSNNPDVWIPAYKISRWYSLFFVLYVLLGVYFVTNLILAVVYDSFKSELAKQVTDMDAKRKNTLDKAFNLIVKDGHDVEHIDKKQCLALFAELNKYRTLPNISIEESELIFSELDDSGDFKINKKEFADLCHAIALKFAKEDCKSYFEYLPFYNSSSSAMLKNFIRGQTFANIVAIILVINLIAVIIETTLDIQDSTAQKLWQGIEFVFGWIYVVEMILKIYAYGFVNYWRDGLNQFDFIVTCVIVVGETLTFASPHGQTFLLNGEWIRYLILARVLRLTRLLMHVKQYRAFIATFLNLLPSLMPYLGTIFCVMCIYSSLGVQLFGGIVNAGNPALEGNDLAENDYLLFNFNDYPNAMVTTFNLVVMGNWQVWMQAYRDLTGTSWSLVYFVSFYLITVMLILNLIIAFVLEAFFAELELEESDESTRSKEVGKSEHRRSRGTKSRSERVDVLLHRILSSELEQSEVPSGGGSSGPC